MARHRIRGGRPVASIWTMAVSPTDRHLSEAVPGERAAGPLPGRASTPPSSSAGCSSSRAFSSSARCGAFARAARGCTSSCATPAARCRARCGASTSSALGVRLTDGMRVVVGGGCDYYPGSASSSPSFTLRGVRAADRRRGRPAHPARAPPPPTPRRRPVRTPEAPAAPAAAADDRGRDRRARQGPRRRPRRPAPARMGRAAVWAFAPVQDRHAAPLIAAALRELAAIQEVEVVIVARGGGSLADLFAFCDEALCRTVALLRVPVISSVGHHTDRTLIDDVAAVCCSTPTHAAEAAVQIDCNAARDRPERGRPAPAQPQPAGDHRARADARAPGRCAGRSTSHASATSSTSSCASCAPAPAEALAEATRARRRPRARARLAPTARARTSDQRRARARARASGARAGRPRPRADAGARLRPGRGPRRPSARVRGRCP